MTLLFSMIKTLDKRRIIQRLLICFFALLNYSTIQAQGTDKTINEVEFQVIKFEKENNTLEMAKYQAKLGYMYMDIQNYPKALDNFMKAIKSNEDLGNVNAIKTICSNIGMIYTQTDNFEQAITYFRKSLRINEKQGKKIDLAGDYINISMALQSLKKYDESNKNAEQARVIAQEQNDIPLLKNSYDLLAENYDKLGKSDKSKEYYELAASIRSHMQKQQLKSFENRTKDAEAVSYAKDSELKNKDKKIEQITKEQQLTLDLLQKQQELADLKEKEFQSKERLREAQGRNERLIIFSLVAGLVLVTIFFIFIFKQLREKKRAYFMLEQSNQQIIEQTKETEKQRDIATHQKKKITDSIQYAKRIQKAVLPPISQFEKNLPDHFILFKPRDIVSGDFFWLTEKEGIIIVAAADCTGHGVPGAFMSMLGVAFLNEIVNKIAINKHIKSLHANEILNQLRQQVISSLHQTGQADETKDGMDIALCVIDLENRHMQFAGAHNPAYIIRNNELQIIQADKMPIGYYRNMDQTFTNQEVSLEYNDTIYIFTDGYYDQFGGKSNSKFFSANFRKLLLEIHKKPLPEQKQLLEKNFDDWKGNLEQVDDVMVMGIKITHRQFITSSSDDFWATKRMLIAEDTDVNYFLLVEALRSTKIQILRVTNGKDAVEFCKLHDVDLILMDIRMPIMNGIEATRQIREFRKDIPIIAHTAQNEPEDRIEMSEAGCNDFITKPIDQKQFISVIKKHLLKS